MYLSKIPTFIIFLLLLVACKLNPPTNPVTLEQKGKIFVTSNVDSALIIVDEMPTVFFTPDTIPVNLGKHTLSLEKKNFISNAIDIEVLENRIDEYNIKMEPVEITKIVVIEDFSNVSCVPCVASNIILENIIKQYRNKVVKIKYPTNFPSSNDIFYLHNPVACDSRIKYYNVFSTPTIWIDGISKPIAKDSLEMKRMINSRLQETSGFNISVKDSVLNGNYQIYVNLQTLDISKLNPNNLYMNVVVIEKEIFLTEPPGSNGETKFYDIMRAMLPNPEGMQLKDISSNAEFDFNFNVQIKNVWNINNITAIVFIQNKNTKEIYQAGFIK